MLWRIVGDYKGGKIKIKIRNENWKRTTGPNKNLFSYIWKYLTSSKIRPTTSRVDKVVFQASDQAMARRFRRARLLPVSNYNARMACLYRSINRLCCGSSRGATTSLMIIYRRVIER